MKLLVFLCILMHVSLSLSKDYFNHKVYDVTPNKEQIDELMKWQIEAGIDFWTTSGAGRPSRIMVSPDVESSFMKFWTDNKIQHELVIEDAGKSIERDQKARLATRAKRSVFNDELEPNFDLYWSFEEMEMYMVRLAAQHPNLVKLDVIGKSYERRDMYGLRISSTPNDFGKKPIIFIDAGVHAREWVGIHSVLYLVHQLVTNATVTAELLDKVDWAIVPNANPDGYSYSFTTDRLWRKNRHYVNATCTGIDLNRNFGYAWKYLPNSCATSSHPGESPISEPETIALTNYMAGFKHNLRMYLATHSYGNYLLWPFGFDFNVYINNWREHEEVGQLWVDTIFAATGQFYLLGNSADILYTANGASDDHAVAIGNANLAFTLELTGGGRYGFDFPQEEVHDLAKETFLGYRQFGLYVGTHYNYD